MALQEFVGAVVMELDGQEIDISSVNVNRSTGRQAVRTMNKTGNIAGFTKGTAQISLSVTAVIPKGGSTVDWDNIEGAKITLTPLTGGQRTSYLDCFTVSAGESYQSEGEARIDIQMGAVRRVFE